MTVSVSLHEVVRDLKDELAELRADLADAHRQIDEAGRVAAAEHAAAERLRAALAAAPRWVSVTEAETALRQLGIALLEHRKILNGDRPAEAQEHGLEAAYDAVDKLAVRLASMPPAPEAER